MLYQFFDILLLPMLAVAGNNEFQFSFSHHERSAAAKITALKHHLPKK
jgi:hypothetical protein